MMEQQVKYETVFTNSKAGMQNVDKEKVQKVVYELSKNSAHYQNEKRKEQALEKKIQQMKDKLFKTSVQEIKGLERNARDSCHVKKIYVHVDLQKEHSRRYKQDICGTNYNCPTYQQAYSKAYMGGTTIFDFAAIILKTFIISFTVMYWKKIGVEDDCKLQRNWLHTVKVEVDRQIVELEATRKLNRSWLHIDMDAFFASCEERDDPSLKTKPMAVGGIGMISTANYVARKFGVRSAMPGFIALKLCPNLIFVPAHFDKYRTANAEVVQVFEKYDPDFESGSLDEAYLDVTDYCRTNKVSPQDVAKQIRHEVQQQTTLTCSIGIAPNKMLSKICSDINKPNGQYFLNNSRQDVMQFIETQSVRKVPFIGKSTQRMLETFEIKTCKDIIEKRGVLKAVFLEKTFNFFIVSALGLSKTEHSMDDEEDEGHQKGIGLERTFRPIKDKNQLEQKLSDLVEGLVVMLERKKLKGKTIMLKLKETNFRLRTRDKTVRDFISSFEAIQKVALDLLHQNLPIEIRLMGIRLTGLASTEEDPNKSGKNFTLNKFFKKDKQHQLVLQENEQTQQEKHKNDIDKEWSNSANFVNNDYKNFTQLIGKRKCQQQVQSNIQQKLQKQNGTESNIQNQGKDITTGMVKNQFEQNTNEPQNDLKISDQQNNGNDIDQYQDQTSQYDLQSIEIDDYEDQEGELTSQRFEEQLEYNQQISQDLYQAYQEMHSKNPQEFFDEYVDQASKNENQWKFHNCKQNVQEGILDYSDKSRLNQELCIQEQSNFQHKLALNNEYRKKYSNSSKDNQNKTIFAATSTQSKNKQSIFKEQDQEDISSKQNIENELKTNWDNISTKHSAQHPGKQYIQIDRPTQNLNSITNKQHKNQLMNSKKQLQQVQEHISKPSFSLCPKCQLQIESTLLSQHQDQHYALELQKAFDMENNMGQVFHQQQRNIQQNIINNKNFKQNNKIVKNNNVNREPKNRQKDNRIIMDSQLFVQIRSKKKVEQDSQSSDDEIQFT